MRLIQSLGLALVCACAMSGQQHNELTPEEQKQGFMLLFNGKNLDGWDGDKVLWTVKDGTIVGCSDDHPFKVNTFLIYKEEFGDFEMKADVRLRNHNSGIQ